MVPTSRDIAELLEEHRIGILSRWLDLLFDLPGGRYRDHPAEEVRTWASGALSAAIQSLAAAPAEPLTDQAARVTGDLSRRGFSIREVIEGLVLLRDASLPFVEQRYSQDARTQDARTRAAARAGLDEGLRRLLGAVASAYAQIMLTDIEKAKARTALMLAAAETAGSSLEPGHVFSKVAHDIATALRVSYCGIYEADEQQVFLPRAAVGELPGERLRQLLARPLRPAIDPIVRAAVSGPEPAPRICAGKEPFLGETNCRMLAIASAVVIPIATGGQVQALALCICEDSRRVFSPEQIEIAWGIARTTAPAVSNAHLHAATVQQLETSLSLQKITSALLDRRGPDEILPVVCAEARRLAGARGSAILRQSAGGSREMVAREGELPASPLAELLAAGSPAILAVPLRTGSDVIGALVLVGDERGFDPAIARRMQLFADQGAIALEHARLNAEHERLVILEERQKLARDLHDSVSQSLYGLTMYAAAAGRLLDAQRIEQARTYVGQLAETALDALREMRLLIFELRPSVFDQAGLVEALQGRLSAVEERAGLVVHAALGDPGRLPQPIEETLHGVAREALNNMLKHAGAANVWVTLRRAPDEVWLEVRDDGRGFDPDTARAGGGLGLHSMEERAGSVGGTLEVASTPGQGTRVRITCSLAETSGPAAPAGPGAPVRPAAPADPESPRKEG
jgi:signal transduction histidine kinase